MTALLIAFAPHGAFTEFAEFQTICDAGEDTILLGPPKHSHQRRSLGDDTIAKAVDSM